MRLFRNGGILTQICGNDFIVLKVAPPLVVTEKQIAEFVSAVRDVVELAHHPGSFWAEALGHGAEGDQRLNPRKQAPIY